MTNQPGRREAHYVYIGSDSASADWLCPQAGVAPLHCRIFWYPQGNSYYIEHFGEGVETWLRDEPLKPGQPLPVNVGDPVRLGVAGTFVFTAELVTKLTAPASFMAPQTLALTPTTAGHAPLTETSAAPPASVGIVADGTRTLSRDEMDALIAQAQSAASQSPTQVVEAPTPSVHAASISIGYDANNDIVIPNGVVSGQHARLYVEDGRYVLEDQGSLNGTWYGGGRVSRCFIQPGDAFALGSYRMVFDRAVLAQLDEARARLAQRVLDGGGADLSPVRIGRDPQNDIVLEAPMISAFHCVLTPLPSGEGYQVQDTGSTNGTFLNSRDNRIEAATVGLSDVLFFGSYRFPVARIAQLGDASQRDDEIALPQQAAFVIGRDTDADVQIDQPQVSRRHAEVRVMGGGVFEIRDLGSSNGTFVNGKRATGWMRVNPGDPVSLGSYQIRLDPDRGVVRKDYHGDIMIQADRVSIDVPDRSGKGMKRILNDVSFTAYPTEFVGLMGPSGAGKTTLMMALNGYTPPSTGRSLINGVDLYDNYNAFRGNIGYVPQDDIVFPQLTVYESLYYTARLRLPSDTTREEIDQKIEAILEQLEIQQTRDVIIGDAVKKGISGGQRKRVNLAQELITEPSLLFLDEPTSGLASEDTINVMKLLRDLADRGKTILLTIHQPSVEAYRMMDNIIYLFQGNMVFYGPSFPDSITYFNPEVEEGPAREQLLADPGNALKPLAEDQREAFSQPSPQAQNQKLGEVIQMRRGNYQASRYYKEFVYDRAGAGAGGDVAISQGSKQKTVRRGAFRQWRILASRAARIKWKDRMNTLILMIQAPIIAAVLALVYIGKVGGEDQYFDTLARGPSALFLLVAAAVWFGASNSAREIVSELAIYRRERMVNLMISSYTFSKFAILGVVAAIQCFLMLVLVYFPLHLEGSFIAMYITLLLASWVGVGMGLTLSALTKSGEAAVALVPLILIPQIILGGVIMPIHEMNAPMKVLSTLMAARWGYESMLHIEYGDDDVDAMQDACGIPDCAWGVGGLGGYTYYPADSVLPDSLEQAGVQALMQGQQQPVSPTDNADVCTAFCSALQNGQELSPIDRSFGVDDEHDTRVEAYEEIAEDGHAEDDYTPPRRHARVSYLADNGILIFFNLMLLGLVMAILKFKDVEVE